MVIRKQALYLFGAIVAFLFVSLLLYSSIDTSFPNRPNDIDQAVANQLGARLKVLEKDFRHNEKMMADVKTQLIRSERLRDELRKVAEREPEPQVEEPEKEKKNEEKPAEKNDSEESQKNVGKKPRTSAPQPFGKSGFWSAAKPSEDSCTIAAEMHTAEAEVQMMDVYDILPFDNPDGGVWKQGWEVTYKEEPPLVVIVVPHSHCDPGWIKTFEDYFADQARNILTEMTQQLESKKDMAFIYAEISFFELWWSQANEEEREAAKRHLASGRLEIVSGGWVMTDEANAHYFSMLTELLEGHEWMTNHLGYKPTSHWSIDPFGLSPTVPYLMKKANVTNAVLQRVHYSVKKHLAKNKQLEFIWRQLWAGTSESTDMKTHVFPFYSYDVPHTCGPDPKICCQFDFRRLPQGGHSCPWGVPPMKINEANVKDRAFMLYDQYRKKSTLYGTNVLLIPLGDDFRYDIEFEWDQQYTNYQKLFKYMNDMNEWNIKAKFGTLKDYFEALDASLKESSKELPTLTGDFFTYSDRDDHYWSGYYTSRPFYKHMDRVLQHYLRSAEIAFALSIANGEEPEKDLFESLVGARRALSLFQHHDGVTGTAKDAVVADYGIKMLSALQSCARVTAASVASLLKKSDSSTPTPVLDVDEKRVAQDILPLRLPVPSGSIVFVFNSLARTRKEVNCVRVPTLTARVKRLSDGSKPKQQLNPVVELVSGKLTAKLCFLAEVGPFGVEAHEVVTLPDNTELASLQGSTSGGTSEFTFEAPKSDEMELATEQFAVSFDAKSGYLKWLKPMGKERVQLNLHFVKYGARGHKKLRSGGGDDLSGAYLFLPDGPAKEIPVSGHLFVAVNGPLMKRVYIAGPSEAQILQIVTLVEGEPWIGIENQVDVRSQTNYEVAMRLKTSIHNGEEIYTDLNGFQMIRRKRLTKLPLQAHYYPMSAAAFIEDSAQRLGLYGAQALGVASLENGWMEVMLDRRLNQDDGRGLFQGVLDNKRTQSSFRLLYELLAEDTRQDGNTHDRIAFLSMAGHFTSQSLLYPFTNLIGNPEAGLNLKPAFVGLTDSLPCDLHVVTLRASAEPEQYAKAVGERRPPTAAVHGTPKHRREAALVLHRLAVECRSIVEVKSDCAASDTAFDLPTILTHPPRSIDETTLTLLYNKTQDIKKASFEPMDLRTFRLHF